MINAIKTERNPIYDWIRVVSILGIITSHFLIFGGVSDSLDWIGRYLAGVFNVVFICLSAVLYGNKWRESGRNCFTLSSFLSKRLVKIVSTLYPYLCMVIIVFIVFSVPLNINSFIFNFLGIGWFSKIQYNGHLWFVTMILICYMSIMFVSRYPNLDRNKRISVLFLLIAISLQFVTDSIGLPGYLFIFLAIYVVLFLWPLNSIVQIFGLKKNTILFVFSLFNGFVIYSLSIGLFMPLSSVSRLLLSLCGFLWIAVMFQFLNLRTNRFVDWISEMSFEMYLVHHILCTGPVSISSISISPIIKYVALIGFTLVLAVFLHWFSQKIQQLYLSHISQRIQ